MSSCRERATRVEEGMAKKSIPASHLYTLGDAIQLKKDWSGIFMKGRREPRIAAVGRSNVGKSSLLNEILGRRLAQTSGEPGKTRKIHFYDWPDGGKILVDLPGYGYAKASADDRREWEKFVVKYLKSDEGLERVMLLWDCRAAPTELDLDALEMIRGLGIMAQVVVTKVDQLKNQSETVKRRREIESKLGALGFSVDPADGMFFWVSAREKKGIRELVKELTLTLQSRQ